MFVLDNALEVALSSLERVNLSYWLSSAKSLPPLGILWIEDCKVNMQTFQNIVVILSIIYEV